MSALRKSFNRKNRDSKRRYNQLSTREIEADKVHDRLVDIKKATKEAKELHRKWEKDKYYNKVDKAYLLKAKTLIGCVDGYRQLLDLPLEPNKEVTDLKANINKLAREKEGAEYFLEEARLEIGNLKKRLGEPQTSGRKERQSENMPRHRAEPELDHETRPFDDNESSRKDFRHLDRRDPCHEPIPRSDSSNSQRGRKESRSYEALEKEIEELKKRVEELQEENKADNRLTEGRAGAVGALNAARDEAARYKQQMETSDATVASCHQNLARLRRECSDLNSQLNNERKSVESLKHSLQHSESREINLRDTIVRLRREVKIEGKTKAEALKSMQQSQANEKKLQNDIDKLQKNLSTEIKAKDDLQATLQENQLKERHLRDTIDRLQRNLSSERQTKDEALSRLRNADKTCPDNNPTITDLSDPNRPMKLAEKVSELYDNEWTDAMENLENDCKIKETDAIDILLNIVKAVFTTFEDIGDKQTAFITSLELPVAVPDIDDLWDTARPLLNNGLLPKLQAELTKPLKDYRKMNCEAVSPLLFQIMKSRLQRVHNLDADTIKACDEFVKDTVSYVWLMRVQDPPVHIDWEFSHGQKFDHDRLRSYTKGGDSIDYVVWPVLYLHKGGPLLAKGVAQGMKTKPK